MNSVFSYFHSPLGNLIIETANNYLISLQFNSLIDDKNFENNKVAMEKCALHGMVHEQLNSYFNGSLYKFNIPLMPQGTTFQKHVWIGLQNIDYGTTISYSEQAKLYGNAKAIRAIAKANGANKIAIIIPCHRVVGSHGQLTGYMAGISIKKKLIQFEYENRLNKANHLLF